MQIHRWAADDWRIKFVGANPSYWYYSRRYYSLTEVQEAIARVEEARA